MNNKDANINFKDSNGREREIPKKGAGRPREYVSPYPQAFSMSGERDEPQALKTELTTLHQIRKDEGTLIWGIDDALPLHILNAIAESYTFTRQMTMV